MLNTLNFAVTLLASNGASISQYLMPNDKQINSFYPSDYTIFDDKSLVEELTHTLNPSSKLMTSLPNSDTILARLFSVKLV